jgi:hypothetical protein
VAEIYRDANDAGWKTNPYAHASAKQRVAHDSVLSLHLAPGGGKALRLKPVTQEAIKRLKFNKQGSAGQSAAGEIMEKPFRPLRS